MEFTSHVDITLCIDATDGMKEFAKRLGMAARELPQLLLEEADSDYNTCDCLRIKVIAFGDYKFDSAPIKETRFFTVDEADELERFISNLKFESGDSPKNALEALALAIKSDWTQMGTRRRHIIALITDKAPLPLGERADCDAYPSNLPKSLDELSKWYSLEADAQVDLKLSKKGKGLFIFAPHDDAWNEIAIWDHVLHFPIEYGSHADSIAIDTIVKLIGHYM